MKPTKAQIKAHKEALELIQEAKSGKVLNHDERSFIYVHYNPLIDTGGTKMIKADAFFTPWGMALNIRNTIKDVGNSLLDFCAGIGVLSYAVYRRYQLYGVEKSLKITCIENNETFYEIGKAIFPEATWILADAFDPAVVNQKNLGQFDTVISNPPYSTATRKLLSNSLDKSIQVTHLKKSAPLVYHAVAMGLIVGDNVIALIPDNMTPESITKKDGVWKVENSPEYKKWLHPHIQGTTHEYFQQSNNFLLTNIKVGLGCFYKPPEPTYEQAELF